MKSLTITLCALAAAISIASAQTVRETTTTTTTPTEALGTITTFDPAGNSVILSGPSNAPVTYGYSKSTVIVDELGNPVAVDIVKTGIPVTVYYTTVNGQMVASKIMVRQAAPVQSTTTTTTTTKEED